MRKTGTVRPLAGLAAGAAVALLALDALVKTPGVAPFARHLGPLAGPAAGAALWFAADMAAFAVAFLLGRKARRPASKALDGDRVRVEALIRKHGALAVTVTRAVPFLAAGVAVVCGASRMSRREALSAAALGSLPAAVVHGSLGTAAGWTVGTPLALGSALALAVAWRMATGRLRPVRPCEVVPLAPRPDPWRDRSASRR